MRGENSDRIIERIFRMICVNVKIPADIIRERRWKHKIIFYDDRKFLHDLVRDMSQQFCKHFQVHLCDTFWLHRLLSFFNWTISMIENSICIKSIAETKRIFIGKHKTVVALQWLLEEIRQFLEGFVWLIVGL